MNAANVSKIKYLVNAVSRQELEDCVDLALAAKNSEGIRNIFVKYLEEKGLDGFIRAGK